jgi:hypothetical protein
LPRERSELHDGDEPTQVVNLHLLVLLFHHTRQVKQLGTLVNLRPKPVLQTFLGFAQFLAVLEGVQVIQDPHDTWKPVHVADVQKLKHFHLKAKTGVHHQDHLKFENKTHLKIFLEARVLKGL